MLEGSGVRQLVISCLVELLAMQLLGGLLAMYASKHAPADLREYVHWQAVGPHAW